MPLLGIFCMNIFILYKVRQNNKALRQFKIENKSNTENDENMKRGTNEKRNIDDAENTQKPIAAPDVNDKQRQEAEVHLTRMLLLITTSFLLFTTPSFVR